MAYRYQQCHCLAPLPAKVSVFNSHMQGYHSAISTKPKLHTKNHAYLDNHQHMEDLFVAEDVFHKAHNILR